MAAAVNQRGSERAWSRGEERRKGERRRNRGEGEREEESGEIEERDNIFTTSMLTLRTI